MIEQAGPRELITHAVAAEQAGFDSEVSSDHYFPWLDEIGHPPNAWVTLGAVAQATGRVGLMTYVTAPTFRYHPAVVAQQAATLQIVSGDRFTIGLVPASGSTNTSSVAVGGSRHQAGQAGGGAGGHHHVVRRRLRQPPRAALRHRLGQVAGPARCACADRDGRLGSPVCGDLRSLRAGHDGYRTRPATAPVWDAARGASIPNPSTSPSRTVAQLPISWDSDADATDRAHRLFRWSMTDWKVNAELPGTAAFDSASSRSVRRTLPARSRAVTTSVRWSRPPASSSTPGSRILPWCRSVATIRTASSPRRPARSCRSCVNSDENADLSGRSVIGQAHSVGDGRADRAGCRSRCRRPGQARGRDGRRFAC